MSPESFHLAEIAVPHDPKGAWGAVMDGMAQCSVECQLERYGYDDLADDATESDLLHFHDQRDRRKLWLVALAGPRPVDAIDGQMAGVRLVRPEPDQEVASPDDVLAVCYANAPLTDNTHLIDAGEPQVRPTARGLGIDEALFAVHDQFARANDRSTVLGWVGHRGAEAAADDPDAVIDPTGEVRLDRADPTVTRYLAAGYSLAQAERHSVQPIPVPDEVLAPACDPSRAEAGGYQVLQWTGLTPDEWLEDMAALNTAMSTDPPLGDVDWRPEIWDAERVRRQEERSLLDGTFATTVIRHRASGRLVGFTQLLASSRKPAVAFQWSTIVLDGHRGHGLGLLLKAANARLLHEAFPSVQRVHTWNADENDHMLGINIALGYVREDFGACWQKVLL